MSFFHCSLVLSFFLSFSLCFLFSSVFEVERKDTKRKLHVTHFEPATQHLNLFSLGSFVSSQQMLFTFTRLDFLYCVIAQSHISLSLSSFYECRERIPKEQEAEGIEVRFERLFSGFCSFMKMFSSSFFLTFLLFRYRVLLSIERKSCIDEWKRMKKEWACEWKEFVPLTVFHFLAFLFSFETWVYFVMMKMCAQKIVRKKSLKNKKV